MSIGRDYDEDEWAANVAALSARGLLSIDGTITDEGTAFKAELEDRTDRIALAAYDSIDDSEVERIIVSLTPLAKAVIAAGDVPPMTPIGPIAAALVDAADDGAVHRVLLDLVEAKAPV